MSEGYAANLENRVDDWFCGGAKHLLLCTVPVEYLQPKGFIRFDEEIWNRCFKPNFALEGAQIPGQK